MTFEQIDHVGIAVHDLDAGIARYQELLGVGPSVRKRMEKDGIDAAMLDLGTTHVELIAPTGPGVGVMGHLVAFIHPKSAGGVLTELVEAHQ